MAIDEPRFLIVAMDGLRPDMISEEACPAVARFMAEGCVWPNARTVFPSETRVVTPTVATGAWPGRHGQIANSFTAPGGGPLINTAPVEGLLAAVEHFGDALVAAPSLGDRLAAADKRYVVVSSGTAGNAYCLNPRARGDGARRPSRCRGRRSARPPPTMRGSRNAWGRCRRRRCRTMSAADTLPAYCWRKCCRGTTRMSPSSGIPSPILPCTMPASARTPAGRRSPAWTRSSRNCSRRSKRGRTPRAGMSSCSPTTAR